MVHRLGRLLVGETSVAVIVTAPHRRPAFDAALEGINRLKKTVPIWKKEHFADGEVWVEGEWDRRCSGGALSSAWRWSRPPPRMLLAQQPPLIRVDVRLVHILAMVKNKTGQLVGGLHKEDFEIYDNGARQEVAVFERQTDQPLSVALLIDVSGSTAIDLKYEIDSASRFLRALLNEGNPRDQVALYAFDDQVTLEQNFTHNFALLARQVEAHSRIGRDLALRCHLSGGAAGAGDAFRAARPW